MNGIALVDEKGCDLLLMEFLEQSLEFPFVSFTLIGWLRKRQLWRRSFLKGD